MCNVSVIIPVPPGRDAPQALRCLTSLDFPLEDLEVVVAEGRSPSTQRNYAARIAGGQFLYFLDDDSFVTPAVVREGLRFFSEPGAAAVGGPALTFCEGSFLEKLFGDVVGSFWGGFITRSRNRPVGAARKVRGEELICCNLMVRRSEYLEASGLKDLYPGEEPELMKRLRNRGASLYYNPKMVVHRTRRKSIPEFIAQAARYGGGRAKHIWKAFEAVDAFFLMPLLFLLYLLLLMFVRPPWLLVPLAAYAAIVGLSSARIAVARGRPGVFPLVVLLFFALHLSYGAGLGYGLAAQALRRTRKRKAGPVVISRFVFSAASGDWRCVETLRFGADALEPAALRYREARGAA